MADVAKLKVDLDAAGFGKVTLDGMELNCLAALAFKSVAGSPTEVTLTIRADVDAGIQAKLDQIALKRTDPEVQTLRTLSGREVTVRSRTPV